MKGEISSSVLTATAFHTSGSGDKSVIGYSGTPDEVEKGLLSLIASDTPGLQVCLSLNFVHMLFICLQESSGCGVPVQMIRNSVTRAILI